MKVAWRHTLGDAVAQFGAWKAKTAQAELAGAWSLTGGQQPDAEWTISGLELNATTDGKTVKHGFALASPCQVMITEGSQYSLYTFLLADDKMLLVNGGAGFRTRKLIYACTYNGTYVYDGTKCMLQQTMGKPGSLEVDWRPTVCTIAIEKKDGRELFTMSGNPRKLAFHGDLLLPAENPTYRTATKNVGR